MGWTSKLQDFAPILDLSMQFYSLFVNKKYICGYLQCAAQTPYMNKARVHFIAAVHRQLHTGDRIKFLPRSLWSRSIRTNFHGPCSGQRATLAAALQTKPLQADIKGRVASFPSHFLRLSACLNCQCEDVAGPRRREGHCSAGGLWWWGGWIVNLCDLWPPFPSTGGFYTRGFFISDSSRNWELGGRSGKGSKCHKPL